MKSKSDKQDETAKIQKLIEEIVQKSSDDDYIYRGEPECYTKTSSGLYRQYAEGIEAKHIDIQVVQKEILKNAKEYTPEKGKSEILSLLQHYGGTTNLIDFTTDYNIALFFACDGKFGENGRIILKKKETVKDQLRKPHKPTERIIAQKSIFVEPPKGLVSVELDETVCISKELKQPILEHLNRYHGISTKTIYNDIHGFIRTQKIHQSAYKEFYLGLTCYDKGDYEKAIEYYNKAIDINPQYAEVYNNRGAAKYELGRYQEAIVDYDQAIRLNPQYAVAYYNRGIAYLCHSKWDEAREDLVKAKEMGVDIARLFRNTYPSFKDFEKKFQDLPDDIKKLLS